MDTILVSRDLKTGSDGSPTSMSVVNGSTLSSVTQLQDIKEEDDVELTRLNSNASSIASSKVEGRSGSGNDDEKQLENCYGVEISMSRTADEEEMKLSSRKSGSRDDLSLLPPLPNTIERVIDQDNNDTGVNNDQNRAMREAGDNEDGGAPMIRNDVDTQFDLSKALEIPVSFTNNNTNGDHMNTTNTGSNNSDSSLSLPPLITSPKISLKKKFSNVLSNTESSMATPIPLPQQDGSPNELSESRAHSIRSKSNSNATAFQHMLPALNMAIDATSIESTHDTHHHYHSHCHNQQRGSQDRKSTRKFSIGDSSSSSYSNTSISEELLYKIPPPILSHNSRSRSCSNSFSNLVNSTTSLEGLNINTITTNPTTAMNTPTSSSNIMMGDNSTKKVPLLRRASSAILRKASIRGNSNRDVLRSTSASTTPALSSKSFFDTDVVQKTPPMDRSHCDSIADTDFGRTNYFQGFNGDSDEEIFYVTQLNDSSRPPSRNPSIRSRVRRGFSRIISSSGSVKRAVSSSSLRDAVLQQDASQPYEGVAQQSQGNVTPAPSPIALSTSISNVSHNRYELRDRLSRDGSSNLSSSKNSPIERRRKEGTSNVTPISTSTLMSPIGTKSLHMMADPIDNKKGISVNSSTMDYFNHPRNEYSTIINTNSTDRGKNDPPVLVSEIRRNTSLRKANQRKKVQDEEEDDVTVDLDKLTQSIPVITVTDNLRSKDCTSIQLQSNIWLDEVYEGQNHNNYKRYIEGAHDTKDESKKPEMMTLRDYISVLVKQQQVEDERLAVLEKSFQDSGWCSKEDLTNIKQKRIIISKKWAERISFYQNKLES